MKRTTIVYETALNLVPAKKKKALDAARDVQRYCTSSFYGSIALPYAHSLDVVDAVGEAGLLRHRTKMEWKRYDRLCRDRMDKLRSGCNPVFWSMLQDFGVKLGGILADDVTMLRLACKGVLDRLHTEHSDLLGYTEAVNIMWYTARVNIRRVMDSARKEANYDISRMPVFDYARLEDVCWAWDNFTDALSGGKGFVDFGADNNVMACIENIARKLFDTDAIFQADRQAFRLNEKYIAGEFGQDFVDSVKARHNELNN